MTGMQVNKIFAAVLVAVISAVLCGFVARGVVHVDAPKENAFKIEVAAEAAAGGAAPAAEAKAEPILALIATADAAKGQAASKVCAACHTFGKGEPARVGPNLWGIIGSARAHMAGFAYSDAMKALASTKWTYDELNKFLWNPKKHIAGTKMVFAGMKKPEDRAALIAWLRTQADAPAALPTDAEIAAEAPKAEAAPATDAAAPAADAAAPAAAAPEAKK